MSGNDTGTKLIERSSSPADAKRRIERIIVSTSENIGFNEMFNSLLIEFLCCSSSHQLMEFNKTETTSLWLNLLPIISLEVLRYCLLLTSLRNQSGRPHEWRLIRSRFIDSEINCDYHRHKLWDVQWAT